MASLMQHLATTLTHGQCFALSVVGVAVTIMALVWVAAKIIGLENALYKQVPASLERLRKRVADAEGRSAEFVVSVNAKLNSVQAMLDAHQQSVQQIIEKALSDPNPPKIEVMPTPPPSPGPKAAAESSAPQTPPPTSSNRPTDELEQVDTEVSKVAAPVDAVDEATAPSAPEAEAKAADEDTPTADAAALETDNVPDVVEAPPPKPPRKIVQLPGGALEIGPDTPPEDLQRAESLVKALIQSAA